MTNCLQIFVEMSTKRREVRLVHTKFGRYGHSDFIGSDVSEQPVDLLSRSRNEKLRVSKPLQPAKKKTKKKAALGAKTPTLIFIMSVVVSDWTKTYKCESQTTVFQEIYSQTITPL